MGADVFVVRMDLTATGHGVTGHGNRHALRVDIVRDETAVPGNNDSCVEDDGGVKRIVLSGIINPAATTMMTIVFFSGSGEGGLSCGDVASCVVSASNKKLRG